MPERQVPTTPQRGVPGYMPLDESQLNGSRENAKYLALTWANYVLKWTERPVLEELPKGIQGSPEQCPLGRAIGAPVSVMEDGMGVTCDLSENEELQAKTGEQEIHVHGSLTNDPESSVGAFIKGFDEGEYPELIDQGDD